MLSEDNIKSIQSSKNVAFAAFVVIGTMIFYNHIIVPHVNYFHTTQKYAQAMDKIAKKTKTVHTITKLKKKQLEELRNDFKDIHTRLFNSVQAEEFFSDIQVIAEQADCTVYSLSFSAANTAIEETDHSKITKNISTNPVILTVAGNYSNIVNLINSLQNRPKQVWIDSINIEAIDDSGALRCELDIRIYVICD